MALFNHWQLVRHASNKPSNKTIQMDFLQGVSSWPEIFTPSINHDFSSSRPLAQCHCCLEESFKGKVRGKNITFEHKEVV